MKSRISGVEVRWASPVTRLLPRSFGLRFAQVRLGTTSPQDPMHLVISARLDERQAGLWRPTHVLPQGFVRVRHCGWMSGAARKSRLLVRALVCGEPDEPMPVLPEPPIAPMAQRP